MFYQASFQLFLFRTWSCLFFLNAFNAFLYNCSCYISLQLFTPQVSARLSRFKLSHPTFQFTPVGKSGFILLLQGLPVNNLLLLLFQCVVMEYPTPLSVISSDYIYSEQGNIHVLAPEMRPTAFICCWL